MGLFSSIFGGSSDEAVERYDRAMDELERVSRNDRGAADDDRWNAANDAAWAARENVPWWRR